MVNLGRIKRHKEFTRERTMDHMVTCPRCGEKHHFDLGCSTCMDALHLNWGAKRYADLSEKIRCEPDLKLRDVAHELGCILTAFRLMATDYYGDAENREIGIRYLNMQGRIFPDDPACTVCKKEKLAIQLKD